ncbi:MAG: xylose isomerase domain-containing protein [Methanolobus sp. T82-4]|nr:MAG: xylose isomerase domain-containing protein [Methanolobus sp. T82-4]
MSHMRYVKLHLLLESFSSDKDFGEAKPKVYYIALVSLLYMILGASSFAGSLPEIASEVQSVELYMPKLGVYRNSVLQKDLLENILDELSTLDLHTSIHAPYFADVPTYPKDVVVDSADMDKRSFRLMEESIELAGRLGSGAVVLHPGRINGNYERAFSGMIENLRSLAKKASDYGVMLGLENKEGTDPGNLCTEVGEQIKAIEEVNSDNLGATLDIGHANLTCGGDMLKLREFARKLAPYIVHVHVHDNMGVWSENYDGDEHMAPGDGIIDYDVLKEIKGYKGIFNMEVFSMEDVAKGRATLSDAVLYSR